MIGNFAKTTLCAPRRQLLLTGFVFVFVCDLHAAILTLGARAFQLIASNFHHLLVSPFFNVLPPQPPLHAAGAVSSGLLCVAR
jgi:hypothetical protein